MSFKSLDEICSPDPRQQGIVVMDHGRGHRPIQLQDLYNEVAAIFLEGDPPESVAREFDKARNLLVYGWFVYEFGMPAMLQAHGTLELALREKFKAENIPLDGRPGLSWFLKQAIERKWIKDGDFPHVVRNAERRREMMEGWPFSNEPDPFDPTATEYCEILSRSLPKIRNHLAHGSSMLQPPGHALLDLEICARIIDCLFPKAA